MPYSSPVLRHRIEIEDGKRDEDEVHYIMLSIKLTTVIILIQAAMQKQQKQVAHAVKKL